MTPEEAAAIANCKECPWAKDGLPPHKPVLAEIPDKPPIAILIGEGPGDNEAREGKPFVGPTGQKLDAALAAAGIPRHRCIVANATACKPTSGKTDAKLGKAAKCCFPLLTKSLHDCGFKVDNRYSPDAAREDNLLPTLAMGKWAAWAVTGKASGTDHSRGFVRGNVILTYHPTYAFFRNPWVRGDFETDLHRFRRLIDGKLQAMPTVVTEPTISDIERLQDEIKANGNIVAVDIETGAAEGDVDASGKDPTRARLKTIALGTSSYSVAMEWPIQNGIWDKTRNILMDTTIAKVFHNGWFFDLRVLKRYGVEVNNIRDTRELRRALVATSPLTLRYLAQTYVDFPPWKEMDSDDEK